MSVKIKIIKHKLNNWEGASDKAKETVAKILLLIVLMFGASEIIENNRPKLVFEQRGCVVCDTMEESKPEMAEDNSSDDQVAIKPKAQEESTRLEADSHSVNLIKEMFPEDKEIAVAIAKAESRLNPKAKGYNCRYNGISQTCKAGDQSKAWSVDCGLMQINTLGQDCPEELMEVEHNLKVAKQIKDEGGWKRWWTFKTNKHLAFL